MAQRHLRPETDVYSDGLGAFRAVIDHGHPHLSFPSGFARGGMPIGLQLVAGAFQESTLLRAGAAYQRATEWHREHPNFATQGHRGAATEGIE